MQEKREMIRKDRQMKKEEAIKFLQDSSFAFLATVNPDGTPYVIPISIVMLDDEAVYIHCSSKGHKIENFENSNKVCLSCAISRGTMPTKEGSYYVDFRSVVASGTIEPLINMEERRKVLTAFCDKQIDAKIEAHKHYEPCVERSYQTVPIYKISLEDISGKQNPNPYHGTRR